MSDLTIAKASQSPTQVPGTAGNSEDAGGRQNFLDMLLGSSAHNMAKSSLLFAQGRAIDATYRPGQGADEDLDPLPERAARPEKDQPEAERSEPADKQQEEFSTKETERKQSPDETAAVHEGSQTQQGDSKASERGQEGMVRADAASKPAAGRESAQAPAPNNDAADALVPTGKDNSKAAAATPAGQQSQGAAAVERAGLVSKPQQALAQTGTETAAETARKVAQPTQTAAEGSEIPTARTADPRAAQEPVIQRPTPSTQPAAPGAMNGNGVPGTNPAAAGLFGQAVAEAAAARSNNAANPGAAANSQQVTAPPKTAGTAMPVTAGAGEPLSPMDSPRTKATNSASQPRATAETVQHFSQQLSRAAALGKDRISLQLNPSELGRVDVKLEFAQDQSMRAVITADRPETLDLLQRDARALERALQDAGDNNALNFAHRQDQQAGGQLSQGGGESSPTSASEATEGEDGVVNSAQSQGRTSGWQGAVNIEV